MLHLFTGTDREKTRAVMEAAVKKAAKKNSRTVRITDANALADLAAALGGKGMFDSSRIVVLNGIFSNEEMRREVLAALGAMRDSEDVFFILEEKPDAATRKQIEKYVEDSERFDLPAGRQVRQGNVIFELANAQKRGDKKSLWVGYQRALLRDEAPEAIHGVLFWGAKQALLAARGAKDMERPKRLVAELAELPHEARRKGFGLEYTLERYILGLNK